MNRWVRAVTVEARDRTELTVAAMVYMAVPVATLAMVLPAFDMRSVAPLLAAIVVLTIIRTLLWAHATSRRLDAEQSYQMHETGSVADQITDAVIEDLRAMYDEAGDAVGDVIVLPGVRDDGDDGDDR